MKSVPENSSRTKGLAAVIVVGLIGIGILIFLSMSGLSGLRDTRTSAVHGESIAGKTGSD